MACDLSDPNIHTAYQAILNARSVVHGRTVGNLFEKHDLQLSVSNKKELEDKLKKNSNAASPRPSEIDTNQERFNKVPSALSSPRPFEEHSNLKKPESSLKSPSSIREVESINTSKEKASSPEPDNISIHSRINSATIVTPVKEEAESLRGPVYENEKPQELEQPQQQYQQQQTYDHELIKPSISIDNDGDRKGSKFVPDNPNILTDEEYRNYNLEIKTKLQEATQIQERVRQKYSSETNLPTQLSGYISIQGAGCYFWKRRWFVLKVTTIYFYRDSQDYYSTPVSCLELKNKDYKVVEAWQECLIPNSFKIQFSNDSEPYYFFSDDSRQKELAMAALSQISA